MNSTKGRCLHAISYQPDEDEGVMSRIPIVMYYTVSSQSLESTNKVIKWPRSGFWETEARFSFISIRRQVFSAAGICSCLSGYSDIIHDNTSYFNAEV